MARRLAAAGQAADALAACRFGADRPGNAGRHSPGPRMTHVLIWRKRSEIGCLLWHGFKVAEAEPELRAAMANRSEAGRRKSRRIRVPLQPGESHLYLGLAKSCDRQAGGGGGRAPHGMALIQKWRTKTPPSTVSVPERRSAGYVSACCFRTRASRGGGGRVPHGAADPAEAGGRRPRRHGVPHWPWLSAAETRPRCYCRWASRAEAQAECRGGGKPAEAGRRQPRCRQLPRIDLAYALINLGDVERRLARRPRPGRLRTGDRPEGVAAQGRIR